MITNEGKLHIKRYLAGMVPSIAQSIALGIGVRAEAAGDTSLQFEVDRSNVLITSYDFVNNKLIFKASVPSTFAGKVYEAAIYSLPATTTNGSKLISTFDSETEIWVTNSGVPTFTTTNARIGIDSLNHTPAASATSSSVLSNLLLDLSEYSASDYFNFAFNNANTNVNTLSVRFKNDNSNYYTISTSNPAAGYNFVTATKGSAVATGTPNWATINSIEVITNSKAAGASNVDWEGLRIEDGDITDPAYVMVARELISVPFTKQNGSTQEVEFALDVSV